MGITRKNALVLLFFGLVGCASTRQTLTEHPTAVVRYSARVGDQLGALWGFPVAIVLYPVMVLASSCADCESRAWAPLAPILFARNVTSTALGGIPWLIFGWKNDPVPEPGSTLAVNPQTDTFSLPRTDAEFKDAISMYYSLWHGVKAPGTELLTSATGQQLFFPQFHGSRLMLCSFDSGNFCDSVDTDVIIDHLRPLHDAVRNNTGDLSVVGFTYGVMFSPPFIADLPASLASIATFPVVNMTKLDLTEPYALLARMPSSILIDGEGIIVDIRLGPLKQETLDDILDIPAWGHSSRLAPGEPPLFIKEYSHRKPFHYYVYAKALPPGHQLQDDDIGRTNVFSKTLLPEGRLLRKSNASGKTLRDAVQAGEVVRESNFN